MWLLLSTQIEATVVAFRWRASFGFQSFAVLLYDVAAVGCGVLN